jgi:hypothetical protein
VNPRREPAMICGIVVAILQALAAFWLSADGDMQGVVNTALVLVGGAVTAVLVRSDQLVPLLTGAAQAVVAVFVAFGYDWSPTQQAALMAPVALLAAYLVRDRVVAPVPPVDSNVTT